MPPLTTIKGHMPQSTKNQIHACLRVSIRLGFFPMGDKKEVSLQPLTFASKFLRKRWLFFLSPLRMNLRGMCVGVGGASCHTG